MSQDLAPAEGHVDVLEDMQIPEVPVDILRHDKRLRAPRFRVPGHDGAVRHAAKAYVI